MANPKVSEQPQVSIVIPTHDHRRSMVLEALRSVIAQRYEKWVAFVIDNASPDNTAEAIAALDHPKIQLLNHATNLGPSGGRNSGIARVQTPWIAFLDSDDLWEPDFLEIVLEEARQHPEVALFATRARMFRDTPDGGTAQAGLTPEADPRTGVAERLLSRGNFFATSSVVVRTDAIRSLGGFDPTLSRSEDTDLWIRLALHYPCRHLPGILTRIRLHTGSTQVVEDPLEKLQRRIYICSKAMATLAENSTAHRNLILRRLRVSWRERARLLTRQGRWREAAAARKRQWHLRPVDPNPLIQWVWCAMRACACPDDDTRPEQ